MSNEQDPGLRALNGVVDDLKIRKQQLDIMRIELEARTDENFKARNDAERRRGELKKHLAHLQKQDQVGRVYG